MPKAKDLPEALEVIERKITELIPAEYNPRYLSDAQFEDLKASLQRFGAVDPAIVNMHKERKNIIISGHQRIKVAQKLGWETFPAVEVKLTRAKERELNIRLNKNTGGWDWDALANYFDVDDLTEWGFTEDELFAYGADEFSEDFELPDGEKKPLQQITFTLADAQAEQIKELLQKAQQLPEFDKVKTYGNENSNGNAIYLIATQWDS